MKVITIEISNDTEGNDTALLLLSTIIIRSTCISPEKSLAGGLI